MGDIDWNAWRDLVHNLAVEKGWYDGQPRSIPHLVALVRTEIAELIECYRDGHGMTETWTDPAGKPCGIPAELADVAIRLCDMAGAHGAEIDTRDPRLSLRYTVDSDDALEQTEVIQAAVSGYMFIRVPAAAWVCGAGLHECMRFAQRHGIDLEAAMRVKHAHNVTRPRRHGGKRA
jgi:hypothetical protein